MLGTFNAGKQISVGLAASLSSGTSYSMTTGSDPYRTGMANARLARGFYWNRRKKDKGMVTTFAFDAFNILNHVNYAGYVGDITSPFFGHANSALPTHRLRVTVRIKF
jgi:hypothetical protein